MIEWYTENVDFPTIEKGEFEKWLSSVIVDEGFVVGDISYILCDDEYILKINNEYLNHDYETDIITFNYVEGGVVSSDIFVSLDTVKDNAKRFGVSYYNELSRVFVHGVLHLVGYDDQTPEQQVKMTEMENKYLTISPKPCSD